MEHRTGAGLEAEEPARPSPQEIADWVSVYTSLIDFTESMLQRTTEEMERHQGPARRHLERTNIRIMKEELDAFERRRTVLRLRLSSEANE